MSLRATSPEDMHRDQCTAAQNGQVVQIIHDTVGKEVIVETKDGKKFSGIFAGVSPENMDVGLLWAYTITPENEQNLLPLKKEVDEKMQFAFSDIVCWSVVMAEEKVIRGFATDRDYHKQNGLAGEEEFQQWEGEDGEEDIDIEDAQHHHGRSNYTNNTRNGGWGVDEMFIANSKMGVKSTFDEDLSQYTTAEVVNDPEARARAEKIAREIEKNPHFKIHALLENDDEERDLDKMTGEDDFEPARRKGQMGRQQNLRGGPAVTNKRAEGLKGGPPGRGLSGPPARYSNVAAYGAPNGNGKSQDVREFREVVNNNGRREGPPKDGKVFENTSHKKTIDNRGAVNSPRNSMSSDVREQGQGGAASRIVTLKEWGQGFAHNFQPSKDAVRQKSEESTSPARLSTTGTNAWTKGPPSSLLNSNPSSTSPSAPSPVTSISSSTDPAEPIQTRKEEVEERRPEPEDVIVKEEVKELEQTSNDGDDNSKAPGDPTQDNAEKAAVKDFQFNLNAPAFVPKFGPSAAASSAPVVQPLQQQPHQAQPNVAMNAMPVQSVPPPVMMPQQQTVMIPTYAGGAGVYQTGPQQFQYMVPAQQMGGNAVRPQQGQAVPQMIATNQQVQQQRRQPQAQVYVAAPQMYSQPAVYQTQQAVPQSYYAQAGYAQTAVPPPQQQYMQMGGGGQPVVSVGGYIQPQRFVTAGQPMGYVMPQATVQSAVPRYPTPQQSQQHDYQSQSQGSQQPTSQPPTPGPQGQAQSVPSPAQSAPLPNPAPSPRTFSPHPMAAASAPPPPHQQFYVQQQMYYPNAVYYPHTGQMTMASGQQQGGHPGGGQDGQGQHSEQMSASMQQPPQQYMTHEQYNQYMQNQGGYYQQPPPGHVRQGSLPPQQQQQQQYAAQQGQQQGMPQQGGQSQNGSQSGQGGPSTNQQQQSAQSQQ